MIIFIDSHIYTAYLPKKYFKEVYSILGCIHSESNIYQVCFKLNLFKISSNQKILSYKPYQPVFINFFIYKSLNKF